MNIEKESLCIEVITHHHHSNAATPSPIWKIITAITAVISVTLAIITASITLYYKMNSKRKNNNTKAKCTNSPSCESRIAMSGYNRSTSSQNNMGFAENQQK